MAIRFVIDSASDVLPAECAALGVTHVPMTVRFGEEEYLDGVTIDHETFYNKLIETDTLPVTSQVPPQRFIEVVEPLVEQGDEVIIITISSVLSGTYQSACIAAQNWPGKVYVIDSLNATIGERLLLLQGLKLAAQETDVRKVYDRLNRDKACIRVLAVLDTLEYLRKGGRISGAVAFAGNLLNIKPVICVHEGGIMLCGKARGSRNMSNMIRKQIEEGNGIDFDRPVCVAYSGLSDAILQKYIADNADLWNTNASALPVATIGSVIGTHVGPGAIGAAYFEKTATPCA